MKTKYKLIVGITGGDLSEIVNRYLSDGYELHGITFASGTFFYQAVIKKLDN